MTKLDLTKEYKAYYTAKSKPELVTIEKARFLSMTGKGDPSGEGYADNLEALYSVAYTLKFRCKEAGNDFVVAKLEGLWNFDEEKYKGITVHEAPLKIPRSEWNYRMLIRMPDFVTKEHLEQAVETVVRKKQISLASNVEWYEMEEGKVVQMLHVGPFSDEPETLKQIMAFCEEHKLSKNGLHHEIYLSDFRKTVPEKLKTILREPVK